MSEGCFQDGGNGIYWLESVQRGKIISQLSIVASQKLVGCCKHINIEGLAFRPFPVKELKHRFILGSTLKVSSNDIKKGFAEVGRASFRRFVASDVFVSGLVRHGINTSKGNESLLPFKAANIADFRHKLRPVGLSNAVHRHDNGVFRQHSSKPIHFRTIDFH